MYDDIEWGLHKHEGRYTFMSYEAAQLEDDRDYQEEVRPLTYEERWGDM